jgi:hypothetical protein
MEEDTAKLMTDTVSVHVCVIQHIHTWPKNILSVFARTIFDEISIELQKNCRDPPNKADSPP